MRCALTESMRRVSSRPSDHRPGVARGSQTVAGRVGTPPALFLALGARPHSSALSSTASLGVMGLSRRRHPIGRLRRDVPTYFASPEGKLRSSIRELWSAPQGASSDSPNVQFNGKTAGLSPRPAVSAPGCRLLSNGADARLNSEAWRRRQPHRDFRQACRHVLGAAVAETSKTTVCKVLQFHHFRTGTRTAREV